MAEILDTFERILYGYREKGTAVSMLTKNSWLLLQYQKDDMNLPKHTEKNKSWLIVIVELTEWPLSPS